MAIELQIKDAATQQGKRLTKIIGLLTASELVKLMDEISLNPTFHVRPLVELFLLR